LYISERQFYKKLIIPHVFKQFEFLSYCSKVFKTSRITSIGYTNKTKIANTTTPTPIAQVYHSNMLIHNFVKIPAFPWSFHDLQGRKAILLISGGIQGRIKLNRGIASGIKTNVNSATVLMIINKRWT
jgi:hypothetical protein